MNAQQQAIQEMQLQQNVRRNEIIENYGYLVIQPSIQIFSSIGTSAQIPRPSTRWEIDYAEALKEVNEIAPGWKDE